MVATPIGNLEDITYRAVRILGEVDVIACEDTRHTSLLLSHYGIRKRLIACHSHNEEESAKGIISLLDQGMDVAYCSDAGTPGISDPGARLAELVRSGSGHRVVPVPGPSAFAALVSAAGNIGKAFTFEGFLSPKKGRRTKSRGLAVGRIAGHCMASVLPWNIFGKMYRHTRIYARILRRLNRKEQF